MSTSAQLKLDDGSGPCNTMEYRELVGSLQYLALTKPDIDFSVNKMAQFLHAPTKDHWSELKRILHYLKGTFDYGLVLKKGNSLHISTFSDADCGGNLDDRTSTTGFIVYLGGKSIVWKSSKYRTMSRSYTEAQYRALATVAAEVLWLQNLLHELHIQLTNILILLCDNIGATYLSTNPVFQSKMKYLALDFHFVRKQVQSKQLQVSYVSSKDQLAYSFTKLLAQ